MVDSKDLTEDLLVKKIADLNEKETINLVKIEVNDNNAQDIFNRCMKGVEQVGRRYEKGIYFLSDLIMAGEIFREIMKVLSPYFAEEKESTPTKSPRVVIGTIKGDIHDLGKNLISFLLKSRGYEVYDIGVDVLPEEFVKEAYRVGADFVGICTLLSSCFKDVKRTVDLFHETGLKDELTIVIGGYPINEEVKKYVGADFFSNDAKNAIEIFEKYRYKYV
ncbi:cobalamin B12-binding domain-containing protein [Natranaerofaba carboxydovora]|uniref:cobalamin B12-binding domain-containing protein n=1 Tax=Natranaerofaba carboxydovora TaxID=2742683 RepID=UPI001F13BC9C|nr:cobalamin-dependent protein [Natranaerofaba carboxydovora]UMZ74758.1 Methionine synthase [Natranaerofaba carboxydovora]